MERINRFIGRTIPWCTLGMVLVTFVIVVLRYVFERGWVWMQEIVIYPHAFTFLLAAGYALARDEHVRVDIFTAQPLSSARPGLTCWAAYSPHTHVRRALLSVRPTSSPQGLF